MSTTMSNGAWFQRLRLALARLDAKFPIALKLALPVLAAVVVGGVFVGYVTYRTEAERIRVDFEKRALLITQSMEVSVAAHTLPEVEEDLDEEIQSHLDALFEAEHSCLLIDVYAIRGGMPTVIASSDPARIGAGGAVLEDAEEDIQAIYATSAATRADELDGEYALKVTSPLRIEGQPALAVTAYLSTEERDQALAALLRNFILSAGVALLLLPLVLLVVLRFLIYGRLRRLLVATSRMQEGDYGARVDGVLPPEARDEMVRLSSRFNAMAEAIQTLHTRLENQATTDELTGLYNRRYILETLEREIARARRRGRPLGAIMLDVDGLKAINDRYGHAVGDEVLRNVAEALRGVIRASDAAARFGGDEFVVLLSDCDGDALRSALERIQQRVEGAGSLRVSEDALIDITVSAGGALMEDGDSADALIHRADLALFEAKRAGRNQVRVAA